jgi:hypothetical protein
MLGLELLEDGALAIAVNDRVEVQARAMIVGTDDPAVAADAALARVGAAAKAAQSVGIAAFHHDSPGIAPTLATLSQRFSGPFVHAGATPAGIAELASRLLKSNSPVIVAGDDVARAGATGALVTLVEAIGASVWFEGLRHHASFPTGHPNYRASLPGDAAQVETGVEILRSVNLSGARNREEIAR